MSQPNPEQEKGAESDFVAMGGQIIERFEDESPKQWRCGRNEQGELIDPPGIVIKDVMHTSIGKIQYGRIAPGSDDQNEIGQWRTDWANPADDNDKA